MKMEEKRILQSFFVPGLLVFLMWLVKFTEWVFGLSFSFLGITPLTAEGLPGILLSPFLHADWNHLMANSLPMLVLGAALFYFYKPMAIKIMLLVAIITGIWVWVGARAATHIGASGLIYGLTSFLMVSGFIRKETRLMAISLIVVFMYGSFIWGIFPELFPEKNISWESHLSGLLSGLVLGIIFRDEGPQRPQYSWEKEEAIEESTQDHTAHEKDGEQEYWNTPEPDQKDLTVVYRFRRNP
ncbi:MAG: rhomboid family intramembrane serine protease [Bacteroidales bacterium]|nr:rhomboid family intramembrane serine protease [Bacteroidales bacterium]